MGRKRHTAEQIIGKLREVEVAPLANGGLGLLRPALGVGLALEGGRLSWMALEAHLGTVGGPTVRPPPCLQGAEKISKCCASVPNDEKGVERFRSTPCI